MSASRWFGRWIERHKRLNPHSMWARYEQGAPGLVYAGWIRSFDESRVTEELANEASESMQRLAERPYPEGHLAIVLATARRISGDRDREVEFRRQAAERAIAIRNAEAEDAFRSAWLKVAEAKRELYRAIVVGQYPHMAHHAKWVEMMARNEWAAQVEAAMTQQVGA